MTGLMSNTVSTDSHGVIDYRAAFVTEVEIVAHSLECRDCMRAALHGDNDEFCAVMQHMRNYLKRAYEALPLGYKRRYEEAMERTFQWENNTQS